MNELANPIVLKVQNLTKKFGGRSVVSGLSFQVRQGEVVGLLGPNGAGKTTSFYMTIGLIHPESGNVYFKNQDVTEEPIHKRAHLGMGYLAQEPSVFRNLTVEENILCILETLPLTKKQKKDRLEELLAELHLEKLAKKKACNLSGGERRRLEITRALVTEPSLLLLDEPFANIDPLAVNDVKKMIGHLKQKGISVLITDHNAREIFSIVDRSYLIQEGKVLMSGSVDELLENKQARSTYFGEDFRL
ncbi:MAG: LPS export ABC transporter ATP-binding protein [Simkaniaceae bacterium]|nr:LPS export ABC transporter ATP-binding protein [Candidatus Sacchlamyda saccharinae]